MLLRGALRVRGRHCCGGFTPLGGVEPLWAVLSVQGAFLRGRHCCARVGVCENSSKLPTYTPVSIREEWTRTTSRTFNCTMRDTTRKKEKRLYSRYNLLFCPPQIPEISIISFVQTDPSETTAEERGPCCRPRTNRGRSAGSARSCC